MRRACIAGMIAAAVALSAAGTSVAQDEPVEFGPTDPPSAEQVYTYQDGDRTVRVVLQPDLEVSEDGSGARSRGEHIVTKDRAGRSTGHPVFRSESSGTLMTLPGGVLLVLDAEWGTAETNAFFARNRITPNRVSAMGITANSFFVETAPGFPSLDLANALATQDGVRLASPNWWREHTTRRATDPGPCARTE